MPEGPETWRDARRVGAALAGRVATRVWFADDDLGAEAAAMSGVRIVDVTARGKALLVRSASGLVLVTHNLLYGRWYVTPVDRRPVTARSLRVVVANATRAALLYSASDIRVLPETELSCHPYLMRLGPDALSPETGIGEITSRLMARRFRGRALAGLLLDQGFVAGLGNYLRSEILFEAGVHHRDRPADLAPPLRDALGEAILAVPRRALATRGHTTLRDLIGGEKDPPRDGRGAPRKPRHHVFARAGRPCPRCGRRILRELAAGRRVYRCAGCQPSRRELGPVREARDC